MPPIKEFYQELLKRTLGITDVESVPRLKLGKVENKFYAGYDQVTIHKFFECSNKEFRLEFFFLERNDLYSLCKYIIWKGEKIHNTKVFPYVYKDLEAFCRSFAVEVPLQVLDLIRSMVEVSEKPKKAQSKKSSKSKKKDDKKELEEAEEPSKELAENE